MKNEIFSKNFIYYILILISFTSSLFLKDNLKNNFALGNHCLIFFIPIVFYSFYEIFLNSKEFSVIKFFIFTFDKPSP